MRFFAKVDNAEKRDATSKANRMLKRTFSGRTRAPTRLKAVTPPASTSVSCISLTTAFNSLPHSATKGKGRNKIDIALAFYKENLIAKALSVARVVKESHLHIHAFVRNGINRAFAFPAEANPHSSTPEGGKAELL